MQGLISLKSTREPHQDLHRTVACTPVNRDRVGPGLGLGLGRGAHPLWEVQSLNSEKGTSLNSGSDIQPLKMASRLLICEMGAIMFTSQTH